MKNVLCVCWRNFPLSFFFFFLQKLNLKPYFLLPLTYFIITRRCEMVFAKISSKGFCYTQEKFLDIFISNNIKIEYFFL